MFTMIYPYIICWFKTILYHMISNNIRNMSSCIHTISSWTMYPTLYQHIFQLILKKLWLLL
ncbi:hypothetical protein Hanom_Chr02g00141221 [Helianthus anomalus]